MATTRTKTGSLPRLSQAASSQHQRRALVSRQRPSSRIAKKRHRERRVKVSSQRLLPPKHDRTNPSSSDLSERTQPQLPENNQSRSSFCLAQHNQVQSKLLCLPAELLEQIYSFALVIEDEKAISYRTNRYQKRRITAGEFKRGKDRKVAKGEFLYKRLGLSLLGPICQRIYWNAPPIFFGRNHFVIEDMFSIGDLFYENPDAAGHIRSLTLNLKESEFIGSETHPWYPDRASLIKKALDIFLPQLIELNLYCSFDTWDATERGGSYSGNWYFMATGDFRLQPFFAQFQTFPKLRTFRLLDTTSTDFSIMNGEHFRKVGLKEAEVWMQQKLIPNSGRC